MTKRALLIGSQTEGLQGVHTDVAAVADRLAAWGFTTESCVKGAATRQGILTRYQALIDETQGSDTVVVYYSGHGGLAANPSFKPRDEGVAWVPRYYQFIVPVDINESSEGDFRGITSIELSALLAQLTGKTKNVTVILDCCHSARMSRDLDLTPKALPRPWYVGVAAHLEQLAFRGIASEGRHVESNPDAVRLVACGPNESAYEYTNDAGQHMGLLSESFLIALAEAEGLQVSWHSLGTRVRERVLSVQRYQRPEVEGPSDRLLFETQTVERTGVLPVILRDDEPVLQGGRLLGVNVGDEYRIVPMGVEKPDPENTIALATVQRVSPAVSKIRLDLQGRHMAVPEGANAFPFRSALPKLPVRITAAGEKGERLCQAVDASRFVRVAADDDPAEILAEVVVTDGEIDLRHLSGLSMVEPKPYGEQAVRTTVSNLDQFARVRALLNLPSGEGSNALERSYEIEWGRVVDGNPQLLAHSGELLFVGDPVYVRVANHGTDTIYCSVFDVGVSGKITLLTASEPSGIEVLPYEDYVYGHKEGVGLTGVKPGWPAGVPRDAPREESLVAIFSDKPQDLRALEQKAMRGEPPLSPLQKMMNQVGFGSLRDFRADVGATEVRYAVERISFLLDPNNAPGNMGVQDRGAFLIDPRPEQAMLLRGPAAKGAVPSQIAIRLKDLIVLSNRALFSTDVRLDTLVVTGPVNGHSDGVYKVETQRFSGINDGDRLPFDNLLIYHGPVAQFVDMAVWVSRDQKDSLTLAEMFKTELNSAEFKTAALALAGLAVAAPQAAAIAGALAAGATLVNIGTKLLLQAVGKSIGLYRTSYLAQEMYGVGRQPRYGVMTAQDFSFAFEVIAVD